MKRLLSALPALLLVTACGSSVSGPADAKNEDANAFVVSLLEDTASGGGGLLVVPWDSMKEMLPGVEFIRR